MGEDYFHISKVSVSQSMSLYLLSIDTESTGLSIYNDHVCQLALAIEHHHADGTMDKLQPFKTLLSCSKEMSAKAAAITGLDDSKLQNGLPPQAAYKQLLIHVNKVCVDPSLPRVLVHYNGHGFDVPLMVADIQRAGLDPMSYFRQLRLEYSLDILMAARHYVDATVLPRHVNGRASYKLGHVHKALVGHEFANAHDALADSRAVLACLKHECFAPCLNAIVEAQSHESIPGLMNPMTLVRQCTNVLKQRKKKPVQKHGQDLREIFKQFKKKRKAMESPESEPNTSSKAAKTTVESGNDTNDTKNAKNM